MTTRTQLEKVWLGAGVLAAIVLAAIGYFFFISPQRSSTSDVQSQIDTAKTQNDTLQARINALNAQNRKLSSYRAALKQAELALPSTSDLPDFLRSLQSLGSATLANVTSLTVGDPTAVTADGSAVTPGAGTTTPAPTASTSAAPADGSTTGATTTQTGPQLFALPITAQVDGTVAQLTNFLGQLQSVQPRAVLVTSVSMGNDTQSAAATKSGTTMDIALEAFVAPGSSVETAQLAQAAND